jgi:hypothetical protein
MRPSEINGLFKVGGLSNVCAEACKQTELKSFFETKDNGKAHGEFLSAVERFFERRNEIAHSLNSVSSISPEEILREVEMFGAFPKDLCTVLET